MSPLRHNPAFTSAWAVVALGGVAILGSGLVVAPPTELAAGQEPRAKVVKPNDGEVRPAADAIRPLHSKMEKPGASDWLAHHKEAGQTFAQYRQRHQHRICNQYQTIYVQPLGEFTATQEKLLTETTEFMGIEHCTAWQCGMNGSNHLVESDRQPLEFCPECQSKLWWTCGVAPLPRFRKLLEFAESRGMEEESANWRKAIERLDSVKTR